MYNPLATFCSFVASKAFQEPSVNSLPTPNNFLFKSFCKELIGDLMLNILPIIAKLDTPNIAMFDINTPFAASSTSAVNLAISSAFGSLPYIFSKLW